MSEQIVEKASMYYKDSGSDKEYHAQVVAKGDGYVVEFAFGRRGAALQSGTKTASPVPLDKAMKVWQKLVDEKKAKGYTEGASGTPYQGTPKGDQVTGLLPQLLNPIDEDEAERLVSDPVFVMQEKFDGRRIMVRVKDGKATGSNRKGLEVALPSRVAEDAVSAKVDLVLDGELVGDLLVAFDLLEFDGADLRGLPYNLRLHRLGMLLVFARAAGGGIVVAETAKELADKKAMLASLRSLGREGVVFKNRDGQYKAGRPASGGSQLKYKFYATCSAIVAQGRDGKRSVALELLDGKKRVPVGNVTILPNFDVPKVGDVVEVRYLYAYKGGSLYQPIYLGKRDDVGHAACVMSQLKYKSEDEG
jgi:bifunctional non-homologous end joining protein LigD